MLSVLIPDSTPYKMTQLSAKSFSELFGLKFVLLILLMAFSLTANAQLSKERQLADQYLAGGEYDKASEIYDQIFDKDPFGVYPNYFKCLLLLKDFNEAEKLIKKIQKRMPNNLSYQADLGYIYKVQGNEEKAHQQYEKTIKSLKPDQTSVIFLANSFTGRQEWDYALMTYQEGKRLLGGVYSFNFETAEVYYQKGEFENMMNEYLDAVGENPLVQQNIQNVLQARIGFDPENKRNDLLRTTLLRRIQRNPDITVYSEMLIWYFVQQKDFESALIQAKALDKRFREDGSRILSLGNLALSNLDYDVAIDCFRYVAEKGREYPNYIQARMDLLNVTNRKITEGNLYTQTDLVKLESDYLSTLNELGRNARTAGLIRGLAHLRAFYLDKPDSAIIDLDEAIEFPGISRQVQAECKLELGDILLFTGEVWDSDLLYAQVDKDFKNDPLGQEAKFRNARLDYFRGDFMWAQAQLDVLKSATSQLIANDALFLSLLISDNIGLDTTTDALMIYSRADLLSYRNKNDEALTTIDSLLKTFPFHSLTDEAWFKAAKIYAKKRNWAAEDSLYKKIIDEYGSDVLADDALFSRAELHETKLKDTVRAMELYQELLTKYPGSLYVVEARKRFRSLRGDFNN
ncbi:MAG: hypothetical protein DWQ44_01305 [Bacteroidetes bacterium]|nr:MAG: hypothetical protein DWQ33_00770 [Bacteroidota bacterium]REK04945.1 MAG: hypothetical protein DWQ39_06950 [Bacteroidota bacterium]REK36551.1 MAG: hypothetical protein DWQ44_01305 [Bacteroidota bacterium]REK50917.1 MAG: hypothetical protein DWQ48_02165 [Bacteroidota bacterium]